MRKSFKNRWLKMTRYEFWPLWLFYSPVFVQWLILSLKGRDMAFFLKINNCMPFGGAIGTNKIGPLESLPEEYKPKTVFRKAPINASALLDDVRGANISFPLILKPNDGERGKGVKLIENVTDLETYIEEHPKTDVIAQEYIESNLEFGVFFYREADGTPHIPSVVMKEFLTVTGNGKDSIGELLCKNYRADLRSKDHAANNKIDLNIILSDGVTVNVEPIGNHNRGTKFLNANHLITNEMVDVFDRIASNIQGFQYGRFDLKSHSLDGLYSGKGLYIVEVNGVNAEPGHIYDPSHGLLNAYRDLFNHMKIIYRLSRTQKHQELEKSKSFSEFIETMRQHLKPLA